MSALVPGRSMVGCIPWHVCGFAGPRAIVRQMFARVHALGRVYRAAAPSAPGCPCYRLEGLGKVDPMGTYGVQIVAIALLIAAQGYFVAAEIALVSARHSALQTAADRGSAGARAAVRLVDDPTRLLSTISVAITLCGFAASALTAVTFEEPVAAWFRSLGLPWMNGLASGLAVFLVTILVTYVNLVFGELAPKRLGLQRAEKVASSVALPVLWLATAVAPLLSL